ncbi:activating signal cointegrator 1 complex subunit 2 isoform X4 [Haemaphysalis longicornis]
MASGNKKEPTDSTGVALHDRVMNVVDKQGQPIQVPALGKGFVEPIYWLKYRPARIIFTFDELMSICADEADGLAEKYSAEIDEWLQRMSYIGDDLTKMLRIPHNRFWSHALYDDGFHQLLESYLRLAPRYTALHRYLITKQMEEAEDRVHKLVFRNFLRLSTNKESKLNFIDKDKFADAIYDNFIFDIPKIMDVCTMFSRGNHDLVCRMINHIMSCQPKYTSDLKDTEDTMLLALERAEESIKSPEDDVGGGPRRLDDAADASELRQMPFWKLLERIHYVVDIATSQATFFEVYPTAAKIFTLENVGHRLAKFFDGTFPLLKEELVRRNNLESFDPVFSILKKRLSYAKSCVLKIFRSLLQSQCLEPLQELGQEKQANGLELPYLESFFGVICNCLTEKHFIVAYQQRYPVEEDISMFDQYNFFVDNTRALYVIQSMCAIYSELGSAPPSNLLQAQDAAKLPRRVPKVPPFQATNGVADTGQAAGSSAEAEFEEGAWGGEEEEGACGGAEASPEVHNLKELFPDLSEVFLQECLKYYNYNHEEVVMALLDNNLPPSLSEPTASTSAAAPLPVFEPRSIYDNDEFDILRRDDIDMSRIHIGKKSKTPKSLDDRGHDKVLKEMYQKYSIVHEVVDDEGLYEDEYDDTYDSNDVGLAEPAPEDELSTRRPFTMPRVLEPRQGRRSHENRYGDRDAEPEPEEAPPRDQFVPNPAEIREQRERRYREKMERMGTAPRRRDFKGGARGQGQSQEVLRDRQYKERHKSTFSHNQRAGADHKRSRGMYS